MVRPSPSYQCMTHRRGTAIAVMLKEARTHPIDRIAVPRRKAKSEHTFEELLDSHYYKEDIKDLLDEAGLPVGGRKDELIERLLEEAEFSPYDMLDSLYKNEVKDICEDWDLPVSGTKDDLIGRIVDLLVEWEEDVEEEEKPARVPPPSQKIVKPERVEVPIAGLVGTEEDFLGLVQGIEGWSPLKRHRTEEGYTMDLRQYLEYQRGYQCRLEGVEMADIVVGDAFPVEVKKNPTQSGYDRLMGQLTRMHRAKNFAVGVICDVRRLEMFLDFKHQIDGIFGDGSVAIVQK